ncbi:unnamed protein product [Spirodela intermedia]|uniref:Hexosyltransferase n=1 Tax=Spirodela intermedia TaxID=51605 RepID=A0A7I8J4E4_SPIIN|nr:unnamed protein product [Spirodela intermedia]CAA6664979.1 unnamed protein product [Spirodela intermedia]
MESGGGEVPEGIEAPTMEETFPRVDRRGEVKETPSCPEIPMPDFSQYAEVDAVVARLPCRYPKAGWARDVFRLQVHLAAANLAVWRARRDGGGRPMMELFRIDDLVAREGDWWLYESDLRRLQLKVAMPVGSCRLALPLRGESNNLRNVQPFAVSGPNSVADQSQREAYATVLHSSESYVCGAIVLAHSIRRSGSRRDLVLLHDKSLSDAKRRALAAAGWKLRMIKRIRNPHAKKFTYNEYNYSKLRLWLLTDYDKVVFVDADAAVLRNVDHLFEMPEMSAAGNDGVLFNSGVMVIEPSNATFSVLMKRRDEIVSYNGGDQGFLNEAFVWWHRLSHNVNYLKIFPENTTSEALHKNRLFGADPPELHVVHYLGQKPWLCYRDYDCNWNIPGGVIYASDEAHRTWWRLHDNIAPALRRFCRLPSGASPSSTRRERRRRLRATPTGTGRSKSRPEAALGEAIIKPHVLRGLTPRMRD